MSEDTVKVAVRIRPLVKTEIERGCQMCLNVASHEPQVIVHNTDRAFTYNYAFPPETNQEDFYNIAIKQMVNHIFEGYNVTILAYGQTGSGKTHSMGTNYVEEEDMGVIPRAIHDIFNIISSKEDWTFETTVSFMELYQEQLYDLLSDKQRNQCIVDIRDDGKNVKIVGVEEKKVNNAEDALKCLIQGSVGRATGATAMNMQSSRSHAIFTLCIHQQKKSDPNTATMAKFHVVDLAGSERSKKTQATGERFKEGVNINKGLLALGNVISQLGEGKSTSHVSYRDSKLTRLLQDSLGGNTMTLMIACVSPADYNLDETLSTLRYADRVRKIKNKPVVNQDPKISEINRLNKLVQEMKLALVDREVSTSCPLIHQELEKMNLSLQKKIRDLTEKLNNNLIEALSMHERAELAEEAREKFKIDLAKILEKCKELLDEFDKNPNNYNEHREKLEALYLNILDIQQDQKKTSEDLVKCDIYINCKKYHPEEEELQHTSVDKLDSSDDLEDFHEKQEEHTYLQMQRNDQVQNINKDLAIKESLITQLLKNSSQIIDHSKEIQEMEQEIKVLQMEKDELSQALQNAQTNNISSKLAETRRKKVHELEKKITELRRKVTEQDKIVKLKEKQDQQIRNISKEMQDLKQTRIKLIRQMRNESDKFSKWKESKERELNRLKDQNRKQINENTRLKMQYGRQEIVFKRKMEEALAANKRLKDALDLQKRTALMKKEKAVNKRDKIRNWINQEVEILVSTVSAEHTLEKLMQDRAMLVQMLDEIQNSSDVDETKILDLTEFLDLRNMQITDLQQKIIESDQENRKQTRSQKLYTMDEARMALDFLFKHTADERKERCIKESEFNDLKEKCEQLQEQVDKYRAKETERRRSKLNNTVVIYQHENENDDMEKESELCKEKHKVEKNHSRTKKSSERIQNKEDAKPRRTYQKPKEDTNISLDDSILEKDDVIKDPDWTKTPLYNRIKKLMNTTKNSTLNRTTVKRTSEGDIKCSCKTKCVSRVCTCNKNKAVCGSHCGCDPDQCKNRNESINRTLFAESKKEYDETGEQNDGSIKKLRVTTSA